MNQERHDALQDIIRYAHEKLSERKRLTTEKYRLLVRLACLEKWMYEFTKEHSDA